MTDKPYTDADVELVTTATEQHHIVADRTDAMGNNPCVCDQWWDAVGDNPSWDEHMAEVALDALAAAGRLAPAAGTEPEQPALASPADRAQDAEPCRGCFACSTEPTEQEG